MNASQGKVLALSWVHSTHKFSRCISCLFPPSNLTFFCPSGKWLICVSHRATNSVLQHKDNSTTCDRTICTTYVHHVWFFKSSIPFMLWTCFTHRQQMRYISEAEDLLCIGAWSENMFKNMAALGLRKDLIPTIWTVSLEAVTLLTLSGMLQGGGRVLRLT